MIKGILTHLGLSLCPSDPMFCHKSKLPPRTSSTICLSTRPITPSGPWSRPGTGFPSVCLWQKELFLGMCFNIVYCFPGGSDSKESACDAGDPGLITGLRISPGEGKGNPLQYSWLENSMDRGTWQATVHGCHKESDMTKHLTFSFTIAEQGKQWIQKDRRVVCKPERLSGRWIRCTCSAPSAGNWKAARVTERELNFI